jgi:hypothetical protein
MSYEVEKIVGKKMNSKGQPEYLVKWVGYPSSANTWEPVKHLKNCLDDIEKYEKKTKPCEKAKKHIAKRTEGSASSGKRTKKAKQAKETKKTKKANDNNNLPSEDSSEPSEIELEEEKSHVTESESVSEEEVQKEKSSDVKDSSTCHDTATSCTSKDVGNIDCDVPKKIKMATYLSENSINCLIDWNPRYDGTVPKSSWYSSQVVKEKYPSLLFQYYESRMVVKK